ncbi:MAG: hypothetical protein WC804_15390 [Sphingomonas sp.]|jgi:hypothetical protein|uniref:hypothetical protein n=1 Tax=Sphingomonas sp. TaxID=28214 RepID=UPI003563A5A1
MKKVSSAAIAAALLVGFGSVSLATPAFAKKEQAAKGPVLSAAVRTPALAAQTELAAPTPDLAKVEASLNTAEAAATTDDERYIVASMRLQLASKQIKALPAAQQSDAPLAKPLDDLIANPKTPSDKLPLFYNYRGQVAYNAKQYTVAAAMWSKARELGYTDADLLLNIARAKVEGGDVPGGMAVMQDAVKAEEAAGKKAPEPWYRYAISRLFKAGDMADTDAWTRAWLAAYGTKENWRSAIYTFGFNGAGAKRLTDRQRVDLYRLMKASGSLAGPREWLDYAAYAKRIGLPNEAQTVIVDGRATKIITASDAEAEQVLRDAKSAIAADKPLAAQEKAATSAVKGDLASQAGDAYLGAGDYAKAAEMYKLAISKGGIDLDPVNLHLGIALALAGNKAEAQTAFAAVKTSPNADIAKLWTTWLISPPAA